MTDLRLAILISGGGESHTSVKALAHALNGRESQMTDIRLSLDLDGKNSLYRHAIELFGADQAQQQDGRQKASLLVSYVYLKEFVRHRAAFDIREWVLDSGAFSAYTKGIAIDLQEYIDTCKRLKEQDPTLTEIFALDVIGDWKASLRNVEEMWRQGVEAIPAYHYGEPEHVLKTLAATYPKIALGGVARRRSTQKRQFAEQCFARVWPKKIHGFGIMDEQTILALPFHSIDATNWELGPCGFGRWKAYGALTVRGRAKSLRPEVDVHLALERRLKARWGASLAELDKE